MHTAVMRRNSRRRWGFEVERELSRPAVLNLVTLKFLGAKGCTWIQSIIFSFFGGGDKWIIDSLIFFLLNVNN